MVWYCGYPIAHDYIDRVCQKTPPQKNTIPHLSKDFNWQQLKSN